MRIVFAGTPEFAATALRALIEDQKRGFEVVLVLTQPDRKAGRGQQLQASAVKQTALRAGLEVMQPERLKSGEAATGEVIERIQQLRADVLVVAAYGLILPTELLNCTPFGALNIHASLLPRWRGAAPIQRALQALDTETGITIMRMDEGLDTGPMLLKMALPIGAQETGASLHDRLAALGARAVIEALELVRAERSQEQPQPEHGVTYASKIDKAECELDWHSDGLAVAAKTRAFDPVPGVWAEFSLGGSAKKEREDGLRLKLFEPVPIDPAAFEQRFGSQTQPGQVVGLKWAESAACQDGTGALVVACARGGVAFHQLQRAGKKRLPADQVLGSGTGQALLGAVAMKRG